MLQPYQRRVVDEKVDLDVKLTLLNSFLISPRFQAVDEEELGRLRRQASAMQVYSDVLKERIEAFKP